MPTYTFMATGEISLADIQRIVELTEAGSLRWSEASSALAYLAMPASLEAANRLEAREQILGANLRGTRLGHTPASDWHYLRLTADSGTQYYVDRDSAADLIAAVDLLDRTVMRAISYGGTLASAHDTPSHCEVCQADTPHRALCDRPHGLAGAIMAGSERLVCLRCSHSTPLSATSTGRAGE